MYTTTAVYRVHQKHVDICAPSFFPRAARPYEYGQIERGAA